MYLGLLQRDVRDTLSLFTETRHLILGIGTRTDFPATRDQERLITVQSPWEDLV